jgi:hypothetical protein
VEGLDQQPGAGPRSRSARRSGKRGALARCRTPPPSFLSRRPGCRAPRFRAHPAHWIARRSALWLCVAASPASRGVPGGQQRMRVPPTPRLVRRGVTSSFVSPKLFFTKIYSCPPQANPPPKRGPTRPRSRQKGPAKVLAHLKQPPVRPPRRCSPPQPQPPFLHPRAPRRETPPPRRPARPRPHLRGLPPHRWLERVTLWPP